MTTCPGVECGELVEFAEMLDWCEAFHALPCSGGIMDQTISFLEARTLLKRAEARFEAMRKKR